MAYHLSVVEICHEINQQDTPPSSNPRTPEMSITRSIQECLTLGPKGGVLLEYDSFKDISLSSEMFEVLFNRGKIGSRTFSYDEIELMYEQVKVTDYGDRVIIYAQEINN
ncbi:hypothetical protein [Cedecea sp.]|jgi:hypothetical protein|uniref:hypothetical protein n=1 Tax=Cedecea sp. TaxID=1970739 RepID=UPI002F3E2D36